jgi:TATA-box binding protein (TBP) (component of TFIID and TFIIIB)
MKEEDIKRFTNLVDRKKNLLTFLNCLEDSCFVDIGVNLSSITIEQPSKVDQWNPEIYPGKIYGTNYIKARIKGIVESEIAFIDLFLKEIL